MSVIGRGHRAPVLISVSLIALAASLPAAEVVVEAARESLTQPGVDAARERVAQQPGGASVVDAESYRTGRASTWQDMLGYAPGVFVQPRFGADESRLSIRGSGLSRTFHGRGVLVLVDGVPANLADGGVDFQAVSPVLLDHVEIHRGAQGAIDGSSTLGGALVLASPTGRTAATLTVRGEAGSFGYVRGAVSGGAAHGAWDSWAGATASRSEGYREHARSQDQRVQGNVGYRFSEYAENRLFVGYANSVSELPGSLTKAQFDSDPRQAAAANISGDQHRDYPLLRVSDRVVVEAGSHRFELGGAYSRKDLFHPIFQVLDQLSHDGLGTARYAWRQEANRFTVLATYGAGLTRAKQFINVAGEQGAQTDDGYQRSTNLTIDAADELTLGRTHLSAGVQCNRATRAFDDYQYGGASGADRSDAFTFRGASPRVGVRQELTEAIQLYGNLSRTCEAPTFGELVAVGTEPGLLDLAEQIATTAELGTRGAVERASWELSVYYAWLRDELVAYHVAPGISRTLNADQTRHAGIELGGDAVPLAELADGDRIRLRASYLLSWFRFRDDEQFGNNAIAGIPTHYGRVEGLYERHGWYAGPALEAAGPGFVDHANTTRAAGWILLGAKAGYRVDRGFSAWVEARNLLAKTYAATYGVVTTATPASAVYNPGDGRAIYAGADWRW